MNTETTMPPVRKTVTVKQPPGRAFALFTSRIAEWWPQGPATPDGPGMGTGTVVLEPRPQGRIYRRHDDGTIEFLGEVQVWEPPQRLLLLWTPVAGAAAATEIEIRFTPEGEGDMTRVDLEHRGWERLGEQGKHTRAAYDSGWDDVLRQYAAAGADNGAAIASLILGIASIVLPILGLLAAPFAIAFGIVGRRRARLGARHGGMATAGVTLGAIGLALSALILGGAITLVSQSANGQDEPVPVRTSQSTP
jgi:uncharacterized protein YndB with AHSA1/START domain